MSLDLFCVDFKVLAAAGLWGKCPLVSLLCSTFSQAKDLIRKMLTVDPEERLSVDEAVSHPWISEREGCAPKAHLHETVDELRKFNSRRYYTSAIQQDFAPEIDVLCILFERCPTEKGKKSPKQHPPIVRRITVFFRCKILLTHPQLFYFRFILHIYTVGRPPSCDICKCFLACSIGSLAETASTVQPNWYWQPKHS